MVAVLKLLFYLCFTWLAFIAVIAMIILGMKAAQAFVKSYFESWYTMFAAVFVEVRWRVAILLMQEIAIGKFIFSHCAERFARRA